MLKQKRVVKHTKIRKKFSGTVSCPRVAVFRSAKHTYAQIIDDQVGKTLTSESDCQDDKGVKKERAYEIGKRLAEKAKRLKIEKVVFDRGGYLYHGRIEAVARGLREGGLKF